MKGLFTLLAIVSQLVLFSERVAAQHTDHSSSSIVDGTKERSNDSKKNTYSSAPGWPSPVDDTAWHSYLTAEIFEYRINESKDARWDVFGWYGGDYERVWFKSEGAASTESSAGRSDVQLLYGRLISRYFDLQMGLRNEQIWENNNAIHSETSASIGVQGLAPYYFDIEPTLFVTETGAVLARFTGVYDFQLSQRLILQPRLEFSLSSESSETFQRGSGFTDSEVSIRLRYELHRKFAPYVGIAFEKSYGGTADFVRAEGDQLSEWMFVTGVRWWF